MTGTLVNESEQRAIVRVVDRPLRTGLGYTHSKGGSNWSATPLFPPAWIQLRNVIEIGW